MRALPRISARIRWLAVLGLAVIGALLVSACGGSNDSAADVDIEVFGGWVGEPADRFREVLSAFERESGLTVRYVGSRHFNGDLLERVGQDDAPDVAVFSQPALMLALAADGEIQSLPSDLSGRVAGNLSPAGAGLGVVDGERFGVPFRAHLKSLVWYSPGEFAAHGYAVPTEWEELKTLTERMRADGLTPWCAGFLSVGGGSGWIGTDWIDDLVLRLHGGEVYDAWVAGDIPFSDDRIQEAFSAFDEVLLAVGQTLGGRRAILSTDWREAANPLLGTEPSCGLHRNASFYEENLPDDISIGPDGDIDVFVLPPIDSAAGSAAVISGEQAAGFNQRAETLALLDYLATPEAALPWASESGFISPYADTNPDAFGREFERRLAPRKRSSRPLA